MWRKTWKILGQEAAMWIIAIGIGLLAVSTLEHFVSSEWWRGFVTAFIMWLGGRLLHSLEKWWFEEREEKLVSDEWVNEPPEVVKAALTMCQLPPGEGPCSACMIQTKRILSTYLAETRPQPE